LTVFLIETNNSTGECDMTIEEKRKHSRIHSMHLLNYIYYDENEDEATQGMGRTLNVSESGILLETHNPINTKNVVSLTIGFEEDVVDIKGRVIYTKKNPNEMFESGIEFFDVDNDAQILLRKYIALFNARPEK
jgi:phage terminase large subunit-like protein